MSADELAYKQRNEEDRALHLGTYEAAVENVLRHMDEKGRRNVQFYLYRVQLHERVKFSDRLEKDMVAANITQAVIRRRDEEVRGLMYLNHEESIGSISLAVLPGAISKVQRIIMAPEGLVQDLDQDMMDQILRIREQEKRQVQAVTLVESSVASLMRELTERDGKERRAPSVAKRPVEAVNTGIAAWDSIKDLFSGEYLEGVSPVIRQKFFKAVCGRGKADVDVGDQD